MTIPKLFLCDLEIEDLMDFLVDTDEPIDVALKTFGWTCYDPERTKQQLKNYKVDKCIVCGFWFDVWTDKGSKNICYECWSFE